MPNVDFGPSYTPPVALATAASSAKQQTRSVVIGVFITLIAVSLMVAQLPASFTVPFAVFLVVFVGAVFFALIRNRVAQEKLGEVKLTISPLELRPNEALHLRFATVARADLTVSQITVKLVQNEFYASGSGKNRTSATKAVFENVVEASAQRFVKAAEEITFDLELPIPEGAATTFMASDNAVTWQVSVTVAIAGWPDWQHLQAITVRP